MTISDRLRRWELFSHFTAEQLDRLCLSLSLREVPLGEHVFADQEEGRDLFLLDEGRVAIQRNTPYGPYIVAQLIEGDLFGESSFVDGLPRSGGARADADSEIVVFPFGSITNALQADSRLSVALHWSIWKSLAQKLRLTNDRLTQFFSASAQLVEQDSAAQREPTTEFHLDLAAKRALFQEQRLSNLEINFLTSLSKEIQTPPGKVIFREGDPGDRMYVVLEGRVMISKFIPGAGEEALAFLERGDYFGEMALIDNHPRSADAKASTEGAVLLAIPREVMSGILDINKVSSLRLLMILCDLIAKRLRELNEKLITWFIFAGGGQHQA